MKEKCLVLLRMVCFLIASLLVVAAVASCAKKTPDGEKPTDTSNAGSQDTGGDVTTEKEKETDQWGQEIIDSGIPKDLKFGGETIDIIIRPRDVWTQEFGGCEDLNDMVNSAVYYRNAAVEAQLDVKIKLHKMNKMTGQNNGKDMVSAITKFSLANSDEADLIVGSAYYLTAPSIKGYFTNFLDSGKMKYIDLSKPYWNQNYIAAAEVYDQLYYLVGDINLSVWGNTMVTYANLNTLETQGINNIFETVQNKEWTVEYMQELLKNYQYEELDGIDGPSVGDKVGLVALMDSQACDSFFGGFRLKMVERQEDGSLAYTVKGNQLLDTLAQLVYNVNFSSSTYRSTDEFNTVFSSGRSMFAVTNIVIDPSVSANLRNMTDRYAILPMPMYGEGGQTEYGALAQDAYNLLAVMNHSAVNTEMMSAFLELMCSKSYEDVRPVYVKRVLSGRYLADQRNVEIMDLIFNSVYFDTSIIYSIQFGDILHLVWRAPAAKGNSPLTVYASNEQRLATLLADFESWFMVH